MYHLFFVCICLKNSIFGEFWNIYLLSAQNRVKWRHKIRPIAKNFRPILIFFARDDAKLMPGEVCQVSCRYSNKWRSYSRKTEGGGSDPTPPPPGGGGLIVNHSPENTSLPKNLNFSATNIVFIILTRTCAEASRSAHYQWLADVENSRTWLDDGVGGTDYRFHKTNDNKRMKRNNDGKQASLFLITQWKTVMAKLMTTFFEG